MNTVCIKELFWLQNNIYSNLINNATFFSLQDITYTMNMTKLVRTRTRNDKLETNFYFQSKI